MTPTEGIPAATTQDMNLRRCLPCLWHSTQWTPSTALSWSHTRTLDRKESGPLAVTVLEAAFDASGITEFHVMDYHLRDEVITLLIARRGEAVAGDDGLLGRDAQDHGAIQSPHDEPPALRDGAVEVGLPAHQHRGVPGSF